MAVLEIVKNIVLIITSCIAGYVAISGLFTWKKQLKGKAEYELARRYMIAVYKFRQALSIVRNPTIFNAEVLESIKESGIEDRGDSNNIDQIVYPVRWKKVNEALNTLDIELFEAEAIWGIEARDIVKDLYKYHSQLFIILRKHLQGRSTYTDTDTLYDGGENDIFNTEVNASISKIENYLRKHLK